MAKTWEELKAERYAKMTPEGRAHTEGYSTGYGHSFVDWQRFLAEANLRDLLRMRRDARRLVASLDDGEVEA